MGRKRLKAPKEEFSGTTRDQLLQLPDGILSTIISLLPLREAVRTSILSKQWRFVWTCHPHLSFDYANVFGRRANTSTSELEFVERVDHIMQQRCIGPNIISFTVCFHLGKYFSSRINHWINGAVVKEVESIHLGLSKSYLFCKNSCQNYIFDYTLLAPLGRKSNVKHLRLDSCTVNVPVMSSNTLSCSLVTIELRRVCISDQLLNNFLLNCVLLEKLSLCLCQGLVKLKIAAPGLGRLKFLCVQDCFRLNKIDISLESLVRLEYTGSPICFSFKCVPNLAEVYLSFTQKNRSTGMVYALTRLAWELPRLEKLNLVSVLSMNALELPDNGPVFTNVKQLFLTVYPFDDEDKLSWVAYILRAFPLLQKLQLNLFSPSFIKQPKKIERLLPECPHKHITEVEINGFNGNLHEVELLKYLLESVIELKILVIDPCQKVFKGFNNWVYEEASSFYKSRMKSVSNWLHEVVPETVHLEVR